jgi:pilus assembly protein FimV
MNRPRKTKLVAALGGVFLSTSLLMSGVVNAAGLGRLTVSSALGQPLSAEVELVSLQPGEFENLTARVASPEAYADAKIEYSPMLRQLRFAPARRADGKAVLKITSSAPINEPFVDVLVEVNWPSGRLLREYPILLDPVGFNEARVAAPVANTSPSTTSSVPSRSVSSPITYSEPISSSVSSSSSTSSFNGDTYGPVKSGDTLNQIAQTVKSDSVSLEQMLVALYRENKSAFIGNNMNQLKSGQILRVPPADQVERISRPDAKREISAQVNDWKSYRGQVASAVAAGDAKPAAGNTAAGKITVATPNTPTAAPSSGDKLKIAKSEGVAGKAGAAGAKGTPQEQLNALREEAIAKDNQVKEANARVATLEKQVTDMRKLMEMKGIAVPADPKAAKMAEKAPEAAKPADTKVTQATPPATPVKTDAKPADTKVADAKPTDTKAVDPKAAPAKPADTKTADATKPATPATTPPATTPAPATAVKTDAPKADAPKTDAPKTDVAKADVPAAPPKPVVPKPVTPPPPQPSFLEENMALIGGGTAGLLGLGGLALFLSRRKKKPAKSVSGNSQLMNTSSIMPSDLKPNTVTGNRAGGLVDTGNSSFLTDFDKTGPGMIDTDEVDPVAEAEVYIAYGRDTQAEEILKEAMARDKSRHAITVKLLEIYHTRKSKEAFEPMARELKDAIGSDNPMWVKVAAMGASIDPTNALYGGSGQAFDATGKFPAGAGMVAAGAAGVAVAATSVAATAPDLDFDLGFSDTAPATAGFDVSKANIGQPSASKPDVDFNLGPESVSGSVAAAKDASLDFDLAFDTPATPHAAASSVAAPAAEPNFDFDLSALSLDTPTAKSTGASTTDKFATTIATPKPAASFAHDQTQPSADFAGFSLDLDNAAGSAGGAGSAAAATKLELAKAYIEIGDAEGAKDILNEVTREGDVKQQAEAKKILAGI